MRIQVRLIFLGGGRFAECSRFVSRATGSIDPYFCAPPHEFQCIASPKTVAGTCHNNKLLIESNRHFVQPFPLVIAK